MKKFLTLFLVVVLTMVPFAFSFAAQGAEPGATQTTQTTQTTTSDYASYVPSINRTAAGTLTNTINTGAGQIAGMIQVVGIGIALVIVVAFGIQWLVATPAKKADLKGKLWNLVIGLAILLLGSSLLTAVINFIASINI